MKDDTQQLESWVRPQQETFRSGDPCVFITYTFHYIIIIILYRNYMIFMVHYFFHSEEHIQEFNHTLSEKIIEYETFRSFKIRKSKIVICVPI